MTGTESRWSQSSATPTRRLIVGPSLERVSAGSSELELSGSRRFVVHDDSRETILPIARDVLGLYVTDVRAPRYIDMLNIDLSNEDLDTARCRIDPYVESFRTDGTRITENLDFQEANP